MTDGKIGLKVGRKATSSAGLLSYGVALLSVALALGLTLLLEPLLRETPTQLFFVAVMVSAWYGGMGSGLLATALSTLAVSYFLIEPRYALTLTNSKTVGQLAVFMLSAVLISRLNESRWRAIRREQKAQTVGAAERGQAQAAKERLETVLSSINDGFYVLDRDWRYTYVNDRLCEITGIDREQMLGYSLWDLFPDVVDTDLYIQLHRALNEQTPSQIEYFYAAWNRWYHHRIYPSSDGLTIFATDITEAKRDESVRKQAEAALQESERKFSAVFDQTFELIGLLSLDGVVQEVNQSALDSIAAQKAHVVGKKFWETPWWTHSQQLQEQLREAIDLAVNGQFIRYEVPFPGSNGTLMVTNFSLKPVFDEADRVVMIIAEGYDITDRKQAEEALRESEERLRIAQQSANVGVWNWDITTNQVIWSEEYYRLYGLDPATTQPSYENWLGSIIEPDRDRTDRATREALKHHTDLNVEFRILHPMQGERWLTAIGQTLCDHSGYPKRMTGIALDITDRKQAEQEREQLLQRERAAREDAETANRIKDDFLAVVSHELRSPLNPILGWSKLLRTHQLDEQKVDYALEVIERNAQMQAQLINDLLDVSRILQGKLSLNPSSVNLVSIIQAAMETVRLSAVAKAIQLDTLLDPQRAHVWGDPGRLQQVVWNLLSNAVKFTPPEGRVHIQLNYLDAQAQITISDTGKGIDPDFFPYVFDRFCQEDAATTRRFGGLGLGLAIARHLVELHGGTIHVDSLGDGQGSTFTVKLPLMPQQPTVNLDAALSPIPLNLHGVKILVVDDDDSTREFTDFLLNLHGASVTAVASASEALAVFPRLNPNVLVSDLGMPDIDGYMLMRQVRALPTAQGGQIPAIALTAFAGEIDYQQAIAAGFQMHLPKPVDPETLVEAIVRLVETLP